MKRILKLQLASLLMLGLLACSSDPDLMAIREGIRNMSIGAETHDTNRILEYIDNDYTGTGRSRSGVYDLLNNHFKYNDNINIIISDINIQLAENRQTAKVSIRVLLTGGDEGKLPERGRLSAITSKWVKQEEGWRVTKAAWKPILLNI